MSRLFVEILCLCLLTLSARAQQFRRYDVGLAEVSVINPASAIAPPLCSGCEDVFSAVAGHSFNISTLNRGNPLDLSLFYRHGTEGGTYSFGVEYDGGSYYGLHTVFGRHSRCFDVGDGSCFSIGGGVSLNLFDVDCGSSLVPDIDLGVEYVRDRLRMGIALRNAVSSGPKSDGILTARVPRALLACTSYCFDVRDGLTLTPYAIAGSILGLNLDLGVEAGWTGRLTVSYTLRVPELRNVFSFALKVGDRLVAGASANLSIFSTQSASLFAAVCL